MFKKLRSLFKRRTLYVVYYSYQSATNPNNFGIGSINFKIYPSLNSFSRLTSLKKDIKNTFDDIDDMQIVIKNIMKVD